MTWHQFFVRGRRTCENLLMMLFYANFASIHFQQAIATGNWFIAPMVLQELLLAMMFLVRRPSVDTSRRFTDWFMATAGTFTPLMLQPTSSHFTALGYGLQLVGFAITCGGIGSLNRSIGIVPANRGIVTTGAYEFVRHPMYAGHLVCLAGYLASYYSVANAALIGATVVAIFARIVFEEELFREYKEYVRYAERVKWRLVPYVY